MKMTEETDRHQLHGAQVVLMVEDLRKTVDFYCLVLGFHFDFDWGDPPTHARVSSGDRFHASAARIRFQKAEPSLLGQKTCSVYMDETGGGFMAEKVVFVKAFPYGDDVLALPVSDLESAAKWYSHHFAMVEVERKSEPNPRSSWNGTALASGFRSTEAIALRKVRPYW